MCVTQITVAIIAGLLWVAFSDQPLLAPIAASIAAVAVAEFFPR